MDDKRFDSFTRALATGTNRRKLLLGLLGIGGVAVVGAELDRLPRPPGGQPPRRNRSPVPGTKRPLAGNVSARFRKLSVPTNADLRAVPGRSPMATPVAANIPNAATTPVVSAPATVKSLLPHQSTRPLRPATPSAAPNAAFPAFCCDVDGCCDTVCYGGAVGDDLCCPDGFLSRRSTKSRSVLPGPPRSNAPVAPTNTCIADTAPPVVSMPIATPRRLVPAAAWWPIASTMSASTPTAPGARSAVHNAQGVYACRVGDECCLSNQDCADTCEACVNFVCVDDPNTFPCGPRSDPDKYCCPATNYSLCCGATQFECCGLDTATGITRECDADGKCCEAGHPVLLRRQRHLLLGPMCDLRRARVLLPAGRGRVCSRRRPASSAARMARNAAAMASAAPPARWLWRRVLPGRQHLLPGASGAERDGRLLPDHHAVQHRWRMLSGRQHGLCRRLLQRARRRNAATASAWRPPSNAERPRTRATANANRASTAPASTTRRVLRRLQRLRRWHLPG